MSTKLYLYKPESREHLNDLVAKFKLLTLPWERVFQRDGGVGLQLFDFNGKLYFRVLSRGYYLENKRGKEWLCKAIFYDSRVMGRNEIMEKFADKIDRAIREGKYEIVTIVEAQ